MDEYRLIWTNRPTLNAGNCNPGDRLMGTYLDNNLLYCNTARGVWWALVCLVQNKIDSDAGR